MIAHFGIELKNYQAVNISFGNVNFGIAHDIRKEVGKKFL